MRTLLAAPKVLLLDEPFSKLDADLRRDFRRFVFDRALSKQLPVLLVTHDKADAQAANGQIVNLGPMPINTIVNHRP
jgi:putative thiamine transport system ATP-binding protein